MEMFHASGLWYGVGDVIQPGNWGRVILGAGPNQHVHFYRELLLEDVRARIAPHRPSRLRSFFGLRTQVDLRLYQREAGLQHGYRVAVPDTAAVHIADLEIFDRLQSARDLATTLTVMTDYWSVRQAKFMEVLTESPATVLERF